MLNCQETTRLSSSSLAGAACRSTAKASLSVVPVLFYTANPNGAVWKDLFHAAGIPAAYEDDIEHPSAVQFAIVWRPYQGLLAKFKNLKGAASLSAGVDHLTAEGQVPPHVQIMRIVDPLMAQRMATFVMGAVVHWQRKIDKFRVAQLQSRYCAGAHHRGPSTLAENPCTSVLSARWDKSIENWRQLDNVDVAVGVMGFVLRPHLAARLAICQLHHQPWVFDRRGLMGHSTAELLAHAGYPTAAWARRTRAPDQQQQQLTGNVHDSGANAIGPSISNGHSNCDSSDSKVQLYHGQQQLHAFLQRSRVLVCLLPLTPETTGILNAELFNQLPYGAVIVNVGRGAHLVEEDLLAALESGQVGHAVLDVFCQEPLPPSSLFWHHPKVQITPHIACAPKQQNAVDQVVENYKCLLEGRPFVNVIDREAGY